MHRAIIAILSAALVGMLMLGVPSMSAGAASAAPRANNGWTVTLVPHYSLPNGTQVEWFYVHGSGQCLETLTPGQVNWGETVYSTVGMRHVLFRVPPIYVFDDCSWSTSHATWQVRITTPAHVVRTGSLYVTTGAAGRGREVSASCLDFSNIVCHGDYSPAVDDNADLEVILGPVSTGGLPSSPFGS